MRGAICAIFMMAFTYAAKTNACGAAKFQTSSARPNAISPDPSINVSSLDEIEWLMGAFEGLMSCRIEGRESVLF
jgi:hypothetical protein